MCGYNQVSLNTTNGYLSCYCTLAYKELYEPVDSRNTTSARTPQPLLPLTAPPGGPEVGGHAVVEREERGGGANLGTHVADCGHPWRGGEGGGGGGGGGGEEERRGWMEG